MSLSVSSSKEWGHGLEQGKEHILQKQSPQPLPTELIEYIIDFLQDNRKALRTVSLVSKLFLSRCQFHLFHTVYFAIGPILESKSEGLPLTKFFSKESSSGPRLGSYVCTLQIHLKNREHYVYWADHSSWCDLSLLAKLIRSLPNLWSLDLQMSIPEICGPDPTDESSFAVFIEEHRSLSVRSLTIQNIQRFSASDAISFTRFTHLFPNLEELTVQLYHLSERPDTLRGNWNKNLKLTTLAATPVDGFQNIIPPFALEGVRSLRVLLCHLLSQETAPRLAITAASLVDLTIYVTMYDTPPEQLARSFRTFAFPHIRKLTFFQRLDPSAETEDLTNMAFGTIFLAILRSAFLFPDSSLAINNEMDPAESGGTALRHVRIVLREPGLYSELESEWFRDWDWAALEDILAPVSPSVNQLETLEIVRFETPKRFFAPWWVSDPAIETLDAEWQEFVRRKFSKEAARKLRF